MHTPNDKLDLLRHPTVIAALGVPNAVDALYHALRDRRMRILSESADDVIALIGVERSRDCTCLPGYRERFPDGQNSSTEVGTSPHHVATAARRQKYRE